MSDAPQGPGWWQASNLKWYPPSDTPGTGAPAPTSPQKKRWILPAAIVAVLALIAGIGAFIVLGDDQADATPVALEAANTTGADPFTDSVTITEITEFPDTVQAVTNELTSQMSTDDTTGTLTTTGTTPGLYGGTRDNTACDPTQLATYLTDNPDKANAWAKVQGIDTDDVADYINTLTPAYLTTDTLVTNHGFKNNKATPRPAVLQAGTAVLIDNTGTPRVRCSCGNPLTKPTTNTKLSDATTTGTPWPTYTTNTVTTITTGPTLGTDNTPDTFTFTDITTGDTYQQPPASAGTTTTTAPPTTSTAPPVSDGRRTDLIGRTLSSGPNRQALLDGAPIGLWDSGGACFGTPVCANSLSTYSLAPITSGVPPVLVVTVLESQGRDGAGQAIWKVLDAREIATDRSITGDYECEWSGRPTFELFSDPVAGQIGTAWGIDESFQLVPVDPAQPTCDYVGSGD